MVGPPERSVERRFHFLIPSQNEPHDRRAGRRAAKVCDQHQTKRVNWADATSDVTHIPAASQVTFRNVLGKPAFAPYTVFDPIVPRYVLPPPIEILESVGELVQTPDEPKEIEAQYKVFEVDVEL
jgi:hypothetical protein